MTASVDPPPARPPVSRWVRLLGIAASAVLLGLYARGGLAWTLGFIALVPWLLTLDAERTRRGALLSGALMSLGFVVAVMSWFGVAIGSYTGLGTPVATALLFALAPLLQPQFVAFALVRQLLGRRHGPLLRALGGASAWVACETLLPKLLGDTLGHGLFPSTVLRQAADLGGAAGLTFLLILVNEALVVALHRWRQGPRALLRPLSAASAVILALGGYGLIRLDALQSQAAEPAPVLRVGMIQSAIVDYERLRQTMGAYAVVRHVLDTHYALSQAAIEHHGVDALLWSETVYPTSFGHPRSADGAALDREILQFVDAVGVPLVFGTYDRDDAGEYNAAAFVEPGRGLLGYYRKTHPFPFTEHVPRWLDGPLLRRWLPWTGSWQPGAGARVLPLRAADGRELNVVPLICLDAVSSDIAIDGARLGAQAIIGLSNDAWFSGSPLGPRLHLAVAAFRSVETRLPQLRVTSNGISAIIDETGEVIAATGIGDRAVLAGALPVRNPAPTLIVRWGDWVGRAGLVLLLLLATLAIWRKRVERESSAEQAERDARATAPYRADVVVLRPFWRALAALLRLTAGVGLLWLALGMLLRHGLQVNSLAQLWQFAALVIAPATAAWAIQCAFVGRASIEAGMLVLDLRGARIEIPLASIAAVQPWRLPLPSSGVDLRLNSKQHWDMGIALRDPLALQQALNAAGVSTPTASGLSAHSTAWARMRASLQRRWFDHALVKFGLFPLLPALPAFRLHQYIAYGGTFGEYYTYGLTAYLSGLLIWWAGWSLGLMLFAAALRVVIESVGALTLQLRP
ncbi:MAG TPA: apolipoprotein N-acyltransferase, partial [Vicinamibacterales bacterium]|nr:apolipoprotein N-acyltransferase [Vicinamibacterales bacterium]